LICNKLGHLSIESFIFLEFFCYKIVPKEEIIVSSHNLLPISILYGFEKETAASIFFLFFRRILFFSPK
jgi:hypothetical protein